MSATSNEQLITEVNTREYFQVAVLNALSNQQIRLCEETIIYVTNILTVFLRADCLYEYTEEGLALNPLAKFYKDAQEADTVEERNRILQRLGDVALFISGLFADSLSRSLVDVDYYIAMGGNAYGYLADSSYFNKNSTVLRDVFAEMAGSFDKLVDVLAEVGEDNQLYNNKDVLRLYEIWLSTGSKRVAGKLQEMGIYPIAMQRLNH